VSCKTTCCSFSHVPPVPGCPQLLVQRHETSLQCTLLRLLVILLYGYTYVRNTKGLSSDTHMASNDPSASQVSSVGPSSPDVSSVSSTSSSSPTSSESSAFSESSTSSSSQNSYFTPSIYSPRSLTASEPDVEPPCEEQDTEVAVAQERKFSDVTDRHIHRALVRKLRQNIFGESKSYLWFLLTHHCRLQYSLLPDDWYRVCDILEAGFKKYTYYGYDWNIEYYYL